MRVVDRCERERGRVFPEVRHFGAGEQWWYLLGPRERLGGLPLVVGFGIGRSEPSDAIRHQPRNLTIECKNMRPFPTIVLEGLSAFTTGEELILRKGAQSHRTYQQSSGRTL